MSRLGLIKPSRKHNLDEMNQRLRLEKRAIHHDYVWFFDQATGQQND